MTAPNEAPHPILASIAERAQTGGTLKAEDIPLLPEETKQKWAAQHIANVLNEAQPALLRALARALDDGLALAEVVAVVSGSDQPLVRDVPERAALGVDNLAFVRERNALADELEAAADKVAGVVNGVTHTYAPYRAAADLLRSGPAPDGVLRTYGLVLFAANRFDKPLDLGTAPDPAVLRAQADAEDAWRVAKEAEIAAKAARLKAEQESGTHPALMRKRMRAKGV